ncbi:hypothetical protein ABFX02_14G014400 [Erythranthe guttata]
MPEKAANFAWSNSNPRVHQWFKILTIAVFLGILILCGSDGLSFHTDFPLSEFTILPQLQQPSSQDLNFGNFSAQFQIKNSNHTHQNSSKTHQNPSPNFSPNPLNLSKPQKKENPRFNLSWVSPELEANYSSNLLTKWLTPGGVLCKDSRTVDIKIQSLSSDDSNSTIELSAGEVHEFVFQAIDGSGEPHCLGGDYFETDLSGGNWKSRPPIKDFGNGTYVVSLQIHPDFAGNYNFTIILLYRHFEGLKFSPARFVFDKVLRVIPIKFVNSNSNSHLPEVEQCKKFDFTKDVWSGRWTRHARNENCRISNDGRYRCQKPSFPCVHPWCSGPLGLLESNGWVYSTHCSFKLYSSEEAWNSLNNRWIFWWGDSNHCDTIRNILHFVLDVQSIPIVPRIFDMNITNPKNPSQKVRFTSIFNGHSNHTGNYQGLDSLSDPNYRELLKSYFTDNNVVPDTMIMNSGLHDGVHWPNIRQFIKGADFAASFWGDVMKGVRERGFSPPVVIYRTTVATGGYARSMAFNPQKMEVFNGVLLDKMREYRVLDRVVDDFDMTYPWHYDNRCNDGVHYGRAPLKAKWRDGQIGHQYFVDLMLGHVLINAMSP